MQGKLGRWGGVILRPHNRVSYCVVVVVGVVFSVTVLMKQDVKCAGLHGKEESQYQNTEFQSVYCMYIYSLLM